MTGGAHAGLREVNRAEGDDVIEGHFNHVVTLVDRHLADLLDLGPVGRRDGRDRSSRAYGLRARIPTMPSRRDTSTGFAMWY